MSVSGLRMRMALTGVCIWNPEIDWRVLSCVQEQMLLKELTKLKAHPTTSPVPTDGGLAGMMPGAAAGGGAAGGLLLQQQMVTSGVDPFLGQSAVAAAAADAHGRQSSCDSGLGIKSQVFFCHFIGISGHGRILAHLGFHRNQNHQNDRHIMASPCRYDNKSIWSIFVTMNRTPMALQTISWTNWSSLLW